MIQGHYFSIIRVGYYWNCLSTRWKSVLPQFLHPLHSFHLQYSTIRANSRSSPRLGLTASSKLDILSFIHIYSSGCHNIKAIWLSPGSLEHLTIFRLHVALYRFSPPLVNLIITCFLPIILWANVAVMDLAHAIGPSYTESCECSDPKEVCS